MFGYVKPFKPEMKICEFDTYKAIYCGLCHKLGKSYGPFARLTLSYDFAFLALLHMAVSEKCSGFAKKFCPANPLKRKQCLLPCSQTDFAAACAMTMLYHKVNDNISDSRHFKKFLYIMLKPFAKLAMKNSEKRYPEMCKAIAGAMVEQAKTEKESHISLDAACHPTASALGFVFSELNKEPSQNRVLYRMGYLLGRFVYLIDAFDDYESDLKTGNFNPFIRCIDKSELNEVKKYAVESINLTMTELASAYELLNINRYKTILDNIIYLGLPNSLNIVRNKGEVK